LCLLAALESCTIYYQESFTFNGSRKPGDATNPKSQFSGRESQFKAAQLLFLRRQLGPQYLDLLQFSSTIARLCAVSVPNEWEVPPIDDGATPCSLAGAFGFERFQRA